MRRFSFGNVFCAVEGVCGVRYSDVCHFAAGLYTLERRRWNLAVPAALLLCMVPYLMTMYQRDINVSPLYMCSYADIPMGLLFGAPLVVYFLAKEKTPVVLLCAVMGVTVECISRTWALRCA